MSEPPPPLIAVHMSTPFRRASVYVGQKGLMSVVYVNGLVPRPPVAGHWGSLETFHQLVPPPPPLFAQKPGVHPWGMDVVSVAVGVRVGVLVLTGVLVIVGVLVFVGVRVGVFVGPVVLVRVAVLVGVEVGPLPEPRGQPAVFELSTAGWDWSRAAAPRP